ncbi:MAG: phage tail tape measure protein [Phycisphaeraceae bacterium]|nr:phage tail tape measure protein [Phycisphaeraceae bacterium]
MTEPIRQEIRADYDGQPAQDAARDMDRLGRETREAGTEAEHAGRKQRDQANATRDQATSADRVIGRLASMAAGYVSIGAAIAAATQALREFRQEQDEAGRAEREARRGVSSLAQLADTPEQFKGLVDAAKQTLAEGGARNLDEAARTVFALESAGQLDQRALFSSLAATGIVTDTDVLANAVSALIGSMGAGETGSARDIVSKGFGASKFAPSTVSQLLQGTARAGVAAGRLGISDEEVLGATTVGAKATGSADIAGSYLRALLINLDKQGVYQGQPLMKSVSQIQAMNLSTEDLFKYLGSQEAVTMFGMLAANKPLYGQAMREITQAQATDAVGRKLALPDTDPGLRAAREAERQETRRLLDSQQRYGTAENLVDAALDAQMRSRAERGVNGPLRWGMRGAAGGLRSFVDPQTQLDWILNAYEEGNASYLDENLLEQMYQQSGRQRPTNITIINKNGIEVTGQNPRTDDRDTNPRR